MKCLDCKTELAENTKKITTENKQKTSTLLLWSLYIVISKQHTQQISFGKTQWDYFVA